MLEQGWHPSGMKSSAMSPKKGRNLSGVLREAGPAEGALVIGGERRQNGLRVHMVQLRRVRAGVG